jgi:hypothetical protein
MSGPVLLLRQLSPQDLQLLCAWYKIRDLLLGHNSPEGNIKKALELASVCEHPHAVWLMNLFGGRDVASQEEARQVFLAVKTIQELFALLVALEVALLRFVELLILAMRLPKRVWQAICW